jgi:hypothetical protein
MTTQHGSALVLQWICDQAPSGTTTLNSDFRSFSDTKSIDFVDETAGADEFIQRLKNRKDSSATWTGLYQATSGSAVALALEPGYDGTLRVSAEGTATGKMYTDFVVFVQDITKNQPYNDVVEISTSFMGKAGWSNGWH